MSDSHEHLERDARLKKLQIETELLEAQRTPRHYRLELLKALSTPAAVIVAVLGIGVSTTQWYSNARATRRVHAEQQLQERIKLLAAPSVAERIAAVASLKATLDGDEDGDAAQVISALANELRAENSPAVRDAVVSVIGRMSTKRPARLNLALSELLSANRDLTREGELYSLHKNDPTQEVSPDSVAGRAASTAAGIVALLRAGATATDLSDTYFARQDFRKITLVDCDFTRSMLLQARFDGATLSRCQFDDAVLMMTTFDSATLDGASFDQTPRWEGPKRRYNYVVEQVVYNLRQKITVRGPSFAHANLKGAQFGHHALFGLVKNGLHSHYIDGVDFKGADLTNADLSHTWFFAIDDDGAAPVADLIRPYPEVLNLIGAVVVSFAGLTLDETQIPDVFSSSAERIGNTFEEANLAGAQLPPPIRRAIEAERTEKESRLKQASSTSN